MTCVACRILEKLIAKRLSEFCKQNGIFSKNQFGFVSNRSTTAQMLTCLNFWTKAVDNSEIVTVAYLDFAKAFDTVSHQKLLFVLESKGIKGALLEWIRSFLSFRSQSVLVNGVKSSSKPVLSGVPQGSVLGPLLFIIYLSDIEKVVNSNIFLFADDCKLFFTASPKEFSESAARFQEDLDSLFNWTQDMQLKLSLPKCSILQINEQKLSSDVAKFKMGNFELTNVKEIKDLGILIDNNLCFESQCSSVVKKASSALNFLFRNFKTRNTTFLLKMYKTYVLPILDYACAVYCPSTVKNIKLLESVQKHFTKRIPEFYFSDLAYLGRLQALKLDSIEMRMLKLSLNELFKIVYGITDVDSKLFFKFREKRHNTRSNSLQIDLQQFHSNKKRFFFSTRVAQAWNDLPQGVVTATKTEAFKRSLDHPIVMTVLKKYLRLDV